jgi:hypothetical protein
VCLLSWGKIILILSNVDKFQITTLLPGLMFVTLSQGMAFPNILSHAMEIFPEKAGVSASILGCGMLIIGFIGLESISFIHIKSGISLGTMYLVVLILFIFAKNACHRDKIIPAN